MLFGVGARMDWSILQECAEHSVLVLAVVVMPRFIVVLLSAAFNPA